MHQRVVRQPLKDPMQHVGEKHREALRILLSIADAAGEQ
jgi:hypothetical protein